MKTDAYAKWQVSPDVRATYTEDGAALLDVNQGICYSLNCVASCIWKAMEGSPNGATLDGIVAALQTHFSMPRYQLVTDTYECLQDLEQKRLIHCNGQAATEKARKRGWLRL